MLLLLLGESSWHVCTQPEHEHTLSGLVHETQALSDSVATPGSQYTQLDPNALGRGARSQHTPFSVPCKLARSLQHGMQPLPKALVRP